MQTFYKVQVNGRTVRILDSEEEAIRIANFLATIADYDYVVVVKENSEIIWRHSGVQ